MAINDVKSTVSGTNGQQMSNQQGSDLNVVLPYIGDTIYTSVSRALDDHEVQKEFNARFDEQHERNMRAARGETSGVRGNNAVSRVDNASTSLLFATLMQPVAENSFMARLMAPPAQSGILSPQQAQNTVLQQTQSQSVAGGGVVSGAGGYVAMNRSTSSGNVSIKFNDLRYDIDAKEAASRQPRGSLLRLFAGVAKNGVSDAQKTEDAADQNLNRELRNEQFKDIDFNNQVGKVKDRLVLKFFKKWDEGDIKFGGDDKEEAASGSGSTLLKALMVAGGLRMMFGPLGTHLSILLGKGLDKLGGAMKTLIGTVGNKLGALTKSITTKVMNSSVVKSFRNVASKVGNATKSIVSKFGNLGSRITNTVDKLKNVGTKVTKMTSKVASVASKAGSVASKVARFGKILGPAGVAIEGAVGIFKTVDKLAAGDTKGAINTGVGSAVDVGLAAASLNPLGLAANLTYLGTTFVGKKLGFISEDTPDSLGGVVTGLMDHADQVKEQAESTKKMMDSTISRQLQGRARVAAKQRPELGDANLIADKFLATDRAADAMSKVKDAADHYADANSVTGQFKSWFGGDDQSAALKKLDAARDDVVKLFDEFVSTYDPNKTHAWEIETQTRIQSEAKDKATTEVEPADADGGSVESAEKTLNDAHEYQPQLDADAMQQAMKTGAEATLLDPRFHTLMRDDMAVIGQQINTQLTG